jgi:hypothetical protein
MALRPRHTGRAVFRPSAYLNSLSRRHTWRSPEEKAFSERNVGRMIAFYRSYPAPDESLPCPDHVCRRPANASISDFGR